MAKVRGPCFSMTARGRLGKGIYFQKSRGGVYRAVKMPGSRSASFQISMPVTVSSVLMSLYDYWTEQRARWRGGLQCITEAIYDFHQDEALARQGFNADFTHRDDARSLYLTSSPPDLGFATAFTDYDVVRYLIQPKAFTELLEEFREPLLWDIAYGWLLWREHYYVSGTLNPFFSKKGYQLQASPHCSYLGATPTTHLGGPDNNIYGTIQRPYFLVM